jgi:hypothetical protein
MKQPFNDASLGIEYKDFEYEPDDAMERLGGDVYIPPERDLEYPL